MNREKLDEKEYILIVDDEPDIRLLVSEELTRAGYDVSTAASGEEALALLQKDRVDLILLDLKMSGIDGLQVMAEVRRSPLSPVVIILTAHPSVDSAITAMRLGGCDYLKKPYSDGELLASVERGMARRRQALRQQEMLCLIKSTVQQLQAASRLEERGSLAQSPLLGGRGLFLDQEKGTATRLGQLVHLTSTEFRLLLCLVERADYVVPFRVLMRELHGDEENGGDACRALYTHLWRLRRKIGNAPDGAPYIVNVRKRGYKFISGKTTRKG